MPGIGTAKEFAALTDGLVQETAKITWQGRELDLRCSVGICSAGCPGVPYDQAYRLADRALYAAKRDGKGRSRVCRQDGTPIVS